MPDFQVDEQPKPVVVARMSGTVLLGQLTERARIEEPAGSSARAHDELCDDRPEAAAQPAADWNRKSHLAAREDGRRHEIPHRGPEHGLGRPSTQLEAPGHRRDVLDEMVVQERHAALERRGHAHLVLLHQQFLQIRLQIDMAHALEHGSRPFLVAARMDAVRIRPA